MCRLTILLLTLTFSGSLSAYIPPNHVVYRVDDRNFEVIFLTGFRSHGTNDNVDDHVSGRSIATPNQNSAWIATTDDVNTARRIGAARYNINQSSRTRATWVYEIAQTDNMYDLSRVLEYQSSRWFIGSAMRDHLAALRLLYQPQREIGALRSILPNQIVRARQLVWDPATGDAIFQGEWVVNPRYNDTLYQNTQMNPGIYDYIMTANYIFGAANTAIFLAASWCIGQGSPRSKSDDNAICGDSEILKYTDKEVIMSQSARTNYIPYDL